MGRKPLQTRVVEVVETGIDALPVRRLPEQKAAAGGAEAAPGEGLMLIQATRPVISTRSRGTVTMTQ